MPYNSSLSHQTQENLARTNFDTMFDHQNYMNIQPFEIENLQKYLQKKKGWVYIAKNLKDPHLKIGRTTKSPWIRAKTLNTAALQGEMEILFACEFMNQSMAEKNIHHALKKFRVYDNKEFFSLSLPDAVEKVSYIKHLEEECMSKYFFGNIYEFDLMLLKDYNFSMIEGQKLINLG